MAIQTTRQHDKHDAADAHEDAAGKRAVEEVLGVVLEQRRAEVRSLD